MKFLKFLATFVVALVVSACGGGGDSGSGSAATPWKAEMTLPASSFLIQKDQKAISTILSYDITGWGKTSSFVISKADGTVLGFGSGSGTTNGPIHSSGTVPVAFAFGETVISLYVNGEMTPLSQIVVSTTCTPGTVVDKDGFCR